MPIDLSAALEYHRRGQLDQAARAYEAALAQEPDAPDALHLLGLVAMQRGNPARGAALIARAVAVRPTEVDYHAHLAAAYWALGRLDNAIACCRAALQLRPDNPEVLCSLGAALVDKGMVDDAIVCFRAALQLQPDLPAAQNNLGNALRLKGDKAGALEHFRLAAQLQPDRAEVRNNLGQTLLEQGDAREALEDCQAALRLRPDYPVARNNLGKVFRECGRLDEAVACFREVIRLNPNQSTAHSDLGGALEDLSEFEQALASYRTALRLNPRDALALARIATLLRDRLPGSDRTAIEGLLTDPTLLPEWRWTLQFGLAQSLDALGEFDRAAALTLEANALRLADFGKWGHSYNPGAHHEFISRLIAVFTPDFFESVRGFGLESERPVFVVGMPRSGTSLVEQILASHPRVFGAGELRLAREAFERVPEVTGRDAPFLDCLAHLDREGVQRLAHRHLEGLGALNATADRVVDKMPENTFNLGLIATLFPHAKLIHCKRDARDVALSCWMTDFTHVRWASNPDHIASRISEYQRLMEHWRRVLPAPMFEVDYATLVADLEGVSRALAAWCGLDWDPACLEFHRTKRPLQTASAPQVRRPVYNNSVGRWMNYQRSLGPLFAKLASRATEISR